MKRKTKEPEPPPENGPRLAAVQLTSKGKNDKRSVLVVLGMFERSGDDWRCATPLAEFRGPLAMDAAMDAAKLIKKHGAKTIGRCFADKAVAVLSTPSSKGKLFTLL